MPLWTEAGWLLFYHGVTRAADGGRCYQAGALLLDHADPGRVVARTAAPLFGPETPEERAGIVDNVVFPTAVDPRAGGLDVYYGMADARIGVVHLRPPGADVTRTARPRYRSRGGDRAACCTPGSPLCRDVSQNAAVIRYTSTWRV